MRAGRILATAALALLCGCGFHLQGRAPLPAAVKTPYLEVPDPQTEFVQSLRHDLLANGVELAQDRTKSSAVISVLEDAVTRRVISVSARNQPNQYEVTYTVRFSVTSGERELLKNQELTATATYSFSEPLLLAKGHEEDILRADMARELAQRVMRLLSRL